MKQPIDERHLIRLLTGELSQSERKELEARVREDGRAEERLSELRRQWAALEPPPEDAATVDLTPRVMEAVRLDRRERFEAQVEPAMPWWARAVAAVLVLTAGIVVGIAAGWNDPLAEAAWTELDPTLGWEAELLLPEAHR